LAKGEIVKSPLNFKKLKASKAQQKRNPFCAIPWSMGGPYVCSINQWSLAEGGPHIKNHMEQAKITFSVSLIEKGLLQLRAKNCGMTMSEYSRRAILGHKIRENLTRKQMKVYKKLFRCQREFVQLAQDNLVERPELSKKYGEMAGLFKEKVLGFKT